MASKLGREDASEVNPLISLIGQNDTIAQCAALIESLGLWVSQAEDAETMRPVHLVTATISAALQFEASA